MVFHVCVYIQYWLIFEVSIQGVPNLEWITNKYSFTFIIYYYADRSMEYQDRESPVYKYKLHLN